jgi:RNA polymerase sigma-70 factor (ECF subfamily)
MAFATEQELIRAALSQDPEAWKELLSLYGGKIYGVALRLLAHEKEAEDVTQEVWIVLSQKLSEFRGEAKLGTWIHRVAANKCLERLRAKKKDKATQSIEAHLPQFKEDGHYVEEFTDWSDLPDVNLEHKMVREELERAIKDLPEEYREVLVLRDVEGLSGEEASGLLGLNEATMKTKLHRARMALRTKLSRKLGKKPWAIFRAFLVI